MKVLQDTPLPPDPPTPLVTLASDTSALPHLALILAALEEQQAVESRRVHPPTVYTYQPCSNIWPMPRGSKEPLKQVPVETRYGVEKPAPGTISIAQATSSRASLEGSVSAL